MEVHFLGTTGYHPNETRHTMSLFVPEYGIAFDAGTGFFRVRDLLKTDHLHIFLSHAHLDHIVGLTFLFDVLYGKESKAHVVAMPDKIKVIQDHLFHESIFPVAPPFQPISLGEPIPGFPEEVKWESFPITHPGGAVGYRFDFPNGKSLGYVTDTTASLDAEYLEKIQGVDLLIHECYFKDGWEDRAELTGHSCLTPVLKVAKAVGTKRLVLVHLNPIAEGAPTDEEVQEAANRVGCDFEVVVPEDHSVVLIP